MNLARKLLLLVSAAMLALLAACNGGDPAPAPAAMPSAPVQPAPPQAAPTLSAQPTDQLAPSELSPLRATLVGDCYTPGGYRVQLEGMPRNGTYITTAVDPLGRNYPLNAVGSSDANGQAPGWSWDCFNVDTGGPTDRAGTYEVTIMDITNGPTGDPNRRTTFSLNVPEGLPGQ